MKRVLGIAIALGLAGLMPVMIGCSEGKEPQAKKESAVEKGASISKKKDITKEPTKKESSGKVEVIDLGKGVKLEMVLIPAGKFMMGSPSSEDPGFRQENETQHQVTLTKAFYMGRFEVTQEQWQAVIGNNPSQVKGTKLPVTNVSWNDCQEFIKKLNAKTDGGYRLPTGAEWEYGCRAGTETAYSFGPKITPLDANYSDSKIDKPVEVGSYKPNAFGLYDMHANVWEWCEDLDGTYSGKSLTDPKPKGVASGNGRVNRGGSFLNGATVARSALRVRNPPTYKNDGTGLRLVKTK